MKVGEYLVAAGLCVDSSLEKALARQAYADESKGDRTALGDILLAMGVIDKEGLHEALRQQHLDRMAQCPLFGSLNIASLLDIYNQAILRMLKPGDTLYEQGDKSDSVSMVLWGTVKLFRKNHSGGESDFQVLAAGESFGEMGVLANQPRMVSAQCIETAHLLIIPGPLFKKYYFQEPALALAVVRKWSTVVGSGRFQENLLQGGHFKELVSQKESLSCVQVLGRSKKAKDLKSKIRHLFDNVKPVLLVGEHGSMRLRAAQLIYENTPSLNGPFLVFEPGNIASFVSQEPGVVETHFKSDLSQMGALFGWDKDGQDGEAHTWQGYFQVAHNGLLVLHNVENLTVKMQRLVAEYLETGLFYPVNAQRPTNATVMIVLTAADELAVSKELYQCLSGNIIELPPLRQRKKDLKTICSHMIDEISIEQGKEISEIDREAMNVITAYDWPGNFRELEDVLRRAVNLAKGPMLSCEEISVGRVPVTGKNAYNLLNLPLVQDVFNSSLFPTFPKIVVGGLFLVVLFLGFLGNPSPESNITLLLVWANWEPLLIISCFFFARIWCSLCPIGFFAHRVESLKHSRFTLPSHILQHGYYLSALLLAIVFWAQAAFDMGNSPSNTAALLIVMLSLAVTFSFLFNGRVWCRILCPLGQMVATFSRASMVEVRSNQTYCSHQCTTYDCHSGNDLISGCAMAPGPFALESNHNCTVCGNCIKLCPHGSVRFNLRPPGWELFNSRSADLVACLFIPLLWGTQLFRALEIQGLGRSLVNWTGDLSVAQGLSLSLACILAFGIAWIGRTLLARVWTEGGQVHGSLFVLAMLPLTYAYEISLRLVDLLNHAADFCIILGNQIGYNLPIIAFRLDMQSIKIVQVFFILLGLFLSCKVLGRIITSPDPAKLKSYIWVKAPLYLMGIISTALVIL